MARESASNRLHEDLPPEAQDTLALLGDGTELLARVKRGMVEAGIVDNVGRAGVVMAMLVRFGLVQQWEMKGQLWVKQGSSNETTPWGKLRAELEREGSIEYNRLVSSHELSAILRLLKAGEVKLVVVPATRKKS